jgi:hypothetical protein
VPVPSQELDFQCHMSLGFFYVQREVIIYFVEIAGIVDLHCLNFLLVRKYKWQE